MYIYIYTCIKYCTNLQKKTITSKFGCWLQTQSLLILANLKYHIQTWQPRDTPRSCYRMKSIPKKPDSTIAEDPTVMALYQL